MRYVRSALAVALVVTAALASGCSADKKSSNEVVLITHDSFDLPKSMVKDFEKRSGITLKIDTAGDAGQLASSLQVSAGDPTGDVAYGVDNTFAAGLEQAHVFDGRMTPIDTGYVCVNVDDAWFKSHHQAPPRSLADLVRPAYKDLFVTEGATTASPGMAFLLATIGTYGDGWKTYWKQLVANGAKIDSGWTQAFDKDYSASGGDRPIVVSYNTDPSYGVKHGRPTTSALLNTCFHQTEYAGVLAGTDNSANAQKVVDWLQGAAVQKVMPTKMYMYPTRKGTPLPADWKRFAPLPKKPIQVTASEIAAHRREWTTAWTDIVSR